MTRVYIVRHCETDGNSEKLFQGSTDYAISEIGERQLKALSERFKGIALDRVYASPYKRAQKTAHAVADANNVPIITDDELREINGGIIEGMTLSDIFINFPKLEDDWINNPQNFAPQRGESMREVYARASAALSRILEENKGKHIALVSHGATIRNILCSIYFGDIERLNDVEWCDNTAVTAIDFDDDLKPSVAFFNCTSHLSEELLPLGSKIVAVRSEETK